MFVAGYAVFPFKRFRARDDWWTGPSRLEAVHHLSIDLYQSQDYMSTSENYRQTGRGVVPTSNVLSGSWGSLAGLDGGFFA
ncbi:hypothetical protein MTBLM1_80093 [Rhodospirillaceae bacterium LM-1]|nr:hypothetical protein MTBLM1_80093 [Rhodospirillaceae bacterium LM-1]